MKFLGDDLSEISFMCTKFEVKTRFGQEVMKK